MRTPTHIQATTNRNGASDSGVSNPLYTPRAKISPCCFAMTQFVIVIDASIVNVALPSIGQALRFARTDLSWVVNAYALAFGGFLLLGGRMADLLGRRRCSWWAWSSSRSPHSPVDWRNRRDG